MQLVIFDFISICFYHCNFTEPLLSFVYITLDTIFKLFGTCSQFLGAEWTEPYQMWERRRPIIGTITSLFQILHEIAAIQNDAATKVNGAENCLTNISTLSKTYGRISQML